MPPVIEMCKPEPLRVDNGSIDPTPGHRPGCERKWSCVSESSQQNPCRLRVAWHFRIPQKGEDREDVVDASREGRIVVAECVAGELAGSVDGPLPWRRCSHTGRLPSVKQVGGNDRGAPRQQPRNLCRSLLRSEDRSARGVEPDHDVHVAG